MLEDLTAREKRWWEMQLEVIEVYDGTEYDEDDVPAQLHPDRGDSEYYGPRILRHWPGAEAGCEEDLGCEAEWTADGDLWFHSEGVNTDKIAYFMQQFLKQWHPTGCWSMTYAEYCSKPRIGEFGGGAIFVTATEIKWLNAHEYIAICREEFKGTKTEGG
jgi:hypothetical protein